MGTGLEVEDISKVEEGRVGTAKVEESRAGAGTSKPPGYLSSTDFVKLLQKVLAEVIGTFFVIFAGCGSVVVNKSYNGIVTFPGICVTWGLIVLVMVYTVGHVSGAHFNPAVTIACATNGRFPWLDVPWFIASQLFGSILASWALVLMFNVTPKTYFGTVPSGSNVQSLVIEIIISFLLMFVVSGIGTDSRANKKQAGVVVGMTIVLNVFVAGPISGASMNPARSLGPALVKRVYKGLWIYILGPIIGTILGAFSYNLIRSTDKSLQELMQGDGLLNCKLRNNDV